MGRLSLFSINELARMRDSYLEFLNNEWDDDVAALLEEVHGEFARRGL